MFIGILNIHKPTGFTSHDVIAKLRKILQFKKIGHTGTLDPSATGVLPVCLGKVTKLIQFLPTDKQYIAEITLGITTDSYDGDGNILTSQAVKANTEQIKHILKQFQGKLIQEVPLTSATHYKGKRLYEYAHKGIIIEDLPTKNVTIYNLSLNNIKDISSEHPILEISVDCSSGTYIRSLANDIGKKLGCGAYLNKLTRTMASGLHLKNSYTLEMIEDIKSKNQLKEILIHPCELINWPRIEVSPEIISKLSHGQYFMFDQNSFPDKQNVFLLDKNNSIVATGEFSQTDSIIKPRIVFL